MIKRILIFLIAIFLCGFGIAITTQADLGTTPISSLPYVLSFIAPLSFGTTTFIINMIFILAQKLILGNEFRKRDYFQIIVTLFFSLFIDLGMYIAQYFKCESYFEQVLMIVIGSAILALGVTLEVISDVLYVPGEGIVRAIARKMHCEFGRVKVYFDIIQCVLAIVLSLVFLNSIQGLREGTILSAILVGTFVSIFFFICCFKFKNNRS